MKGGASDRLWTEGCAFPTGACGFRPFLAVAQLRTVRLKPLIKPAREPFRNFVTGIDVQPCVPLIFNYLPQTHDYAVKL
jgi:hypothetical protein